MKSCQRLPDPTDAICPDRVQQAGFREICSNQKVQRIEEKKRKKDVLSVPGTGIIPKVRWVSTCGMTDETAVVRFAYLTALSIHHSQPSGLLSRSQAMTARDVVSLWEASCGPFLPVIPAGASLVGDRVRVCAAE